MEFRHISVLLGECIDNLNIKPNGVYIDGTLGGAGHSLEICKKLDNGRLIGIDQDMNAIEAARIRLIEYKDKVDFVHSNFSNFKNILIEVGINKVDGILLDLGVSSHQLDEKDRGFSYMNDAPLDMRMDVTTTFSAFEVVNTYSKEKLIEIISSFGEERWAKRIAEFIVKEREENTINTTLELVSIIKKAVPKNARKDGPHPAKRTFQAIRIEVNGELSILRQAVHNMVEALNPGGRLCIITFHSLEDRIIKNAFREEENPCTCPPQFPICICNNISKGRVITKRPILPTDSEIEENHRSRSAKLRVFEKKQY